ncbi:MAG: CPBP family intramembrane metalloprotease [Defluviitaleaceae bacterium]|nr:CPBP family intramembrane metalloprotease [Defluviitaleaceae bacterium]
MFNIGFYHSFVTLIMIFQIIIGSGLTLLGLSIPMPFQLILGSAIFFGLPACLYVKLSGQKFQERMEFKKLSPKNILYIVCLSISVYPAALFVSAIASLFFTDHIPEVLGTMADGANPIIMFMAICMSPAFFEEIFFRGFLGKPLKHLGFKGALLNGLYFGLIHLNPHQFFYVFALGVLLYYMLILGGSIWAPIISHLIINSLGLMLFYLSPIISEYAHLSLNFLIIPTIIFVILLRKFIDDNKGRLIISEDLKAQNLQIITPSFAVMIAMYLFIIFSFSLF